MRKVTIAHETPARQFVKCKMCGVPLPPGMDICQDCHNQLMRDPVAKPAPRQINDHDGDEGC